VACIGVAEDIAIIVRRLIDGGVRTLEQMEILMVLVQDPGKAWSLDALRRGAIVSTQRGQELVDGLERCGLVVRDEQEARLRLGPSADVAALRALRASYERDRTNVINAFFACNLASLRSFVDAFKLRRNG
jgi:hypothetical protein